MTARSVHSPDAFEGTDMISPYVSTYATFCVFCIIILLILLSQTGYSFGDERDVIYFRMLAISIIIQTASQGIWVFRSEIPIGFNQRAAYHLNLLDLLGMAGSVYWWFLYIFIQGQHKKFIEKKQAQLRAILFSIPFLFVVVFDTLSEFNNLVFYIDATNSYVRGPLYNVHVIICYGYYAASIVISTMRMLTGDRFEREFYMRLTVFSLIPAIGGLLQVLLKNAPYAVMGNVLGVFNMYCGRQNSRINTDALTGINNRGRAEEYLEGIQKNVKDNPIYIYMLDVDNFKFVNDTFGHNEGDRCLRALADALQAVGRITPSLFISRIGGDEFLCTSDVARTDPEVVMEAIRKTFSEQTKLKNMRTEVSLSIGYSIYDNPSVRIVDVMHAADQALYREKKQHHSLRA